MELIRSHDALFKFVFGEPEQMAELLKNCLPPALAAGLDLSTLRRLDTEIVDDGLKKVELDAAFEIQIDGAWVLLHIGEHKSWADRWAAFQIAGYDLRLLEHWRLSHPDYPGLPAVLPLVVHHGERPWSGPRSLADLVHFGRARNGPWAAFLRPFQLQQTFLLLDLACMSERQIDAMQLSPVSALTLRFLQFLPRCPASAIAGRLRSWRRLIVDLAAHPRGAAVERALSSWFLGNSKVDHHQIRNIMSKTHAGDAFLRTMLDEVLDMGEARGIARGMERGMVRGYQQLFTGLLTQRFGPLPDDVAARVAIAEAAAIERWSGRLLGAQRLEDVFTEG
jgi:hypothetical protein